MRAGVMITYWLLLRSYSLLISLIALAVSLHYMIHFTMASFGVGEKLYDGCGWGGERYTTADDLDLQLLPPALYSSALP
jgi:hypothetical protein